MELSDGMKLILKRITKAEVIDQQTYYTVVEGLEIFQPMVQSSEKLGKVPIGRHNLELTSKDTDFSKAFE